MNNETWIVIGKAQDEETEKLLDYIEMKIGFRPKFFALYSTMMAFIRHSGLGENDPVAYCEGQLIGTFDQVSDYFRSIGLE